MKRETILTRLEKIKVSKNSKAYNLVKEIATGENPGDLIRPCYTLGHGRYIKNADYTDEVRNILIALRVKFEFGNDAPRGGLPGNYFKILHLR